MEARHIAERLSVAEHDVSAAAHTPTIRRTALAMDGPQGCERSPKVPRAPGELFLRHSLGVRPLNIPRLYREKQMPIVVLAPRREQ
eukprot:1410808-Amphidinium_carterae.1